MQVNIYRRKLLNAKLIFVRKIKHLKVAADSGYIPDRKTIEINGDLEKLKTKFISKREGWDYPAFFGFSSKILTWLLL